MKQVLKLISPFKKLTAKEKLFSTIAVIVLLFIVWSLSGSSYLPTPLQIASAYPKLFGDRYDLGHHFVHSLSFCLVAMGWSVLFGLIVCYLSVLPLFSTLCEFLRKFRFLPSAGLSFLFMKMTGNIEQQKEWMMIFGITTWMIYTFVGVALSITDDDVQYARSLRLSRWQTMKETLILGKAAELFEAAIGCFAIAWMLLASIENITKASGGIGVVLAESNKYFKFEEVYAIQFLILVTGISVDFILRKMRKWLFPYTQ